MEEVEEMGEIDEDIYIDLNLIHPVDMSFFFALMPDSRPADYHLGFIDGSFLNREMINRQHKLTI